MVVKQLTHDGRIVDEKDWRRNNLEIERRIKEKEDERRRIKEKELESRTSRIEVLKKVRQDEADRRKVEDRRRMERGLKDVIPRFGSEIGEVLVCVSLNL